MSAGPSLYRRHRPRAFGEVVGQEHIVRTLANAVSRDRVHHAYLFVGSRGTGKTSMAKILAACLNCEHGPTVEPCGICASCSSIAAASSLDVVEMDAASSNSVDDIRALRDSVAFAPVSGRRKVYILDEAHMLSTAAWNAFLKTLEEPPPDTVFVLATTEPQKVLPTVVDRCHRFDFHRPSAEQIAVVLRRTAEAEGITVAPEAVAVLARHASGSFRDALGTLEQLQTYAGETIALADVLAVLGLSDIELLFEALDAMCAGDARGALHTVASALDAGHDPAAFIRELESHARELLIVKTVGGEVPEELRLTQERDERICAQAAAASMPALVRLLDLLAAALVAVRAGADARTQLELALVKAARPELDPSLAAIGARLERLEGGAPVAPAPQRPPARSQPPAERHAGERDDQKSPKQPSLTLEALVSLWPAVLDTLRAEHAMLGAVVADARPVELDGDRLVLAFGEGGGFLARKAEDRAHRAVLAEAVRSVTGRVLALSYEVREDQRRPAVEPLSEEELIRRLKEEFDAEELPGSHQEEAH